MSVTRNIHLVLSTFSSLRTKVETVSLVTVENMGFVRFRAVHQYVESIMVQDNSRSDVLDAFVPFAVHVSTKSGTNFSKSNCQRMWA